MWQKVSSFFRQRGLHPFPLLDSIHRYSIRKAIADLRAGTNVALLDFPQGMAYALIAGCGGGPFSARPPHRLYSETGTCHARHPGRLFVNQPRYDLDHAQNDKGELVEHALEQSPKDRPEIAIVHVEGDLFFASSDLFLDQMRHVVTHPSLSIIILRLRNAYNLDATVPLTIQDLVHFARAHGRDVIVSVAHPYVERVFKNSGLLATLGEANVFRCHPENPTIRPATRSSVPSRSPARSRPTSRSMPVIKVGIE